MQPAVEYHPRVDTAEAPCIFTIKNLAGFDVDTATYTEKLQIRLYVLSILAHVHRSTSVRPFHGIVSNVRPQLNGLCLDEVVSVDT